MSPLSVTLLQVSPRGKWLHLPFPPLVRKQMLSPQHSITMLPKDRYTTGKQNAFWTAVLAGVWALMKYRGAQIKLLLFNTQAGIKRLADRAGVCCEPFLFSVLTQANMRFFTQRFWICNNGYLTDCSRFPARCKFKETKIFTSAFLTSSNLTYVLKMISYWCGNVYPGRWPRVN